MLLVAETRIPVRFRRDEAGVWHFRVANPIVVGGGQRTLEGAMRAAAEAIAFSLEDEIPGGEDGSQVEYLRVAVG
jgi:hypothetical protein